jgi:hypothetical protein
MSLRKLDLRPRPTEFVLRVGTNRLKPKPLNRQQKAASFGRFEAGS